MIRPTKARFMLLLGCVALICVGGTFLNVPPRPDSASIKSAATQLAAQAEALGGVGGSVVVITRDTDTFPQPAMEILLERFTGALQGGKLGIGEIKTIQTDPLRPLEVPPGDFFESIRKAKSGDVIVSFLGPPFLLDEQFKKLGAVKGKVVAFCPGELADIPSLQTLANGGFLHGAVVSVSQDSGKASGSSAGSGSESYRTMTLDELKRGSAGKP